MQLVELNKSTYQYGFIDIKSEEKKKAKYFGFKKILIFHSLPAKAAVRSFINNVVVLESQIVKVYRTK